jgi:hypothetical protein
MQDPDTFPSFRHPFPDSFPRQPQLLPNPML